MQVFVKTKTSENPEQGKNYDTNLGACFFSHFDKWYCDDLCKQEVIPAWYYKPILIPFDEQELETLGHFKAMHETICEENEIYRKQIKLLTDALKKISEWKYEPEKGNVIWPDDIANKALSTLNC